jgi:chromosome segregation ATPase
MPAYVYYLFQDSGYASVKEPQTRERKTYQRTASKEVSKAASKETYELNAIKTMNKNLTEKIKTLRQKINEQNAEFNAEKMNMIRSHKRETDTLKKIHEKTLERLSVKKQENSVQAQENKTQADEIKRMKLTIETLRKTERELRDKLEKAKIDGKYRTEYEKQKREMSASKEEIRRLEEQIEILENTVAEKDKEISKAKKQNVDLSSEIESLVKKDDMEAMQNNIIGKMEAMHKDLQKLFTQQMQSQKIETETGQQSERSKLPLPPIAEKTPQSTLSTEKKPYWKSY